MLIAQLTGLPQWNPSLLPPSVASLPTLPVSVGGTAIVPAPTPTPVAPLAASYLTANSESGLPQSRKIAAGSGIVLTDNGAGSTLIITAAGGGSGPTFVNVTSSSYTVPINATGSGASYIIWNDSGAVLTVHSHNGTDTFSGAGSLVIEGLGARTIYDYAVGTWAVI